MGADHLLLYRGYRGDSAIPPGAALGSLRARGRGDDVLHAQHDETRSERERGGEGDHVTT
jgi:hypothetical protein